MLVTMPADYFITIPHASEFTRTVPMRGFSQVCDRSSCARIRAPAHPTCTCTATLPMLVPLLALVAGQSEYGSGTRFISNETLVSSTCTGAFNTPCAIATTNRIVTALVSDLAVATDAAAETKIFEAVASGNKPYTEPINFWATVYSASGECVATGRPGNWENVCTNRPQGRRLASGATAEAMAAEEAGFPQPGLWSKIVTAATTGDGHYIFTGFDNYNKVAHTNDAVPRVGYARQVTTPTGTVLYVTSAFSDVPLTDSWTSGACSPAFGTLCSISYARRTLGKTATVLRAQPCRISKLCSPRCSGGSSTKNGRHPRSDSIPLSSSSTRIPSSACRR